MKIFISLFAAMALTCGALAQSIGEGELSEIRGSFQRDPSTVAIMNILTNDKDIKSNALNRELQGKIDHHFKYRVDVSGITNQKSSGRCWMFTSMNVLRPSIMEKYDLKEFDFSHNYLFFWDMFEKSNLFFENIIRTADRPIDERETDRFFSAPIDDGGVWSLYYNVTRKYGVVPDSVMPETAHSENTSELRALLREKLRREGYIIRTKAAEGMGEKGLREYKTEALKDIYRILALCLGEPPTEFTWRYKDRTGNIVTREYTPLEFYAEVTPADFDPENYIMVMNDPVREYYKIYEIDNNRNVYEGINWFYLNLPSDVIKQAALASIKNNEAMYASCDVGKQHNRATGIMDPKMYDYESLFGVELSMDKKARIVTHQSGSSHAMALIGCDTDDNDVPVKWEFENSWGPTAGNKGYLTFTDEWFDDYMFRVVIHRRYLDRRSLDALGQKPIMLPAWDYME